MPILSFIFSGFTSGGKLECAKELTAYYFDSEESMIRLDMNIFMEMWRKLALNEVALAVVFVNFPDMKNIQMITIAPRYGEEKGSGRIRMEPTKFESSILLFSYYQPSDGIFITKSVYMHL